MSDEGLAFARRGVARSLDTLSERGDNSEKLLIPEDAEDPKAKSNVLVGSDTLLSKL